MEKNVLIRKQIQVLQDQPIIHKSQYLIIEKDQL